MESRFLSDEKLRRAEDLAQFAEQRGHGLLALAFSWLAARSEIRSVIAGATSAAQIEANVQAVGWHLDAAELAEVDRRLAPD